MNEPCLGHRSTRSVGADDLPSSLRKARIRTIPDFDPMRCVCESGVEYKPLCKETVLTVSRTTTPERTRCRLSPFTTYNNKWGVS
jgi:hypothetical protein